MSKVVTAIDDEFPEEVEAAALREGLNTVYLEARYADDPVALALLQYASAVGERWRHVDETRQERHASMLEMLRRSKTETAVALEKERTAVKAVETFTESLEQLRKRREEQQVTEEGLRARLQDAQLELTKANARERKWKSLIEELALATGHFKEGLPNAWTKAETMVEFGQPVPWLEGRLK